MINTIAKKHVCQSRRAVRVRKRLKGTSLKPRLSINKSNKHIQVQLIDDDSGVTLGQTATFSKEFRGTQYSKKCKSTAKVLGEKIAEIAKGMNIKEVVFDRGRFKYHGILAELADSARSAGLQF